MKYSLLEPCSQAGCRTWQWAPWSLCWSASCCPQGLRFIHATVDLQSGLLKTHDSCPLYVFNSEIPQSPLTTPVFSSPEQKLPWDPLWPQRPPSFKALHCAIWKAAPRGPPAASPTFTCSIFTSENKARPDWHPLFNFLCSFYKQQLFPQLLAHISRPEGGGSFLLTSWSWFRITSYLHSSTNHFSCLFFSDAICTSATDTSTFYYFLTVPFQWLRIYYISVLDFISTARLAWFTNLMQQVNAYLNPIPIHLISTVLFMLIPIIMS